MHSSFTKLLPHIALAGAALSSPASAEIFQIAYQATITDAHYGDGTNALDTNLLGPLSINSTALRKQHL